MITTFQQHVLNEQQRFPGATTEFSWLVSGITLATKMIESQVRRAGLTGIIGSFGEVNVQGEVQQKLDVYANEALIHCLSLRESIGIIASEENEEPLVLRHDSPAAKYAIVFDPLDGSSNIDVAVTIGTTFAVFRRPDTVGASARAQAGRRRLRRLRLLDRARLQRGQRRPRLHPRPPGRLLHPDERAPAHARARQLLLGQRVLLRPLAPGLREVPEPP